MGFFIHLKFCQRSARCLLGSEILASDAIDFDYARKRATWESNSNYSASTVE